MLITHCISFIVIGGANLNLIEAPGTSSSETNYSKSTENWLSSRKFVECQRSNNTMHGQSGVKRRKKQSKLGMKGPFQKRKTSNTLDFLNQDPAEETQTSLQPVDHEEAHRKRFPVSNAEIINFLSSEEAALYLEKVLNKEIQSERHDIVCKMFRSGKIDFGIHSKIFHLSQVQFLEDAQNIDNKLSEILSRLFEKVDIWQLPEMRNCASEQFDSRTNLYRHKYIFHVLVPEGIVKYLQDKNGWDKKTAENFYLDGESRVTNYELQQFDQELDEDAKREKERKLRERYNSEESEDGTSSNYNDDSLLLDQANMEPENNECRNKKNHVIPKSKKRKKIIKKGRIRKVK